jgi:hypothetical protein
MTGAALLLSRLAGIGVSVRVEGGRLCLHPASALSPEFIADLRAGRAEVLALVTENAAARALASPEQAADPDDWTDEHDAGWPATGTEARTRLDERHAATVAGYRRAALQRPPSWPGADPAGEASRSIFAGEFVGASIFPPGR